MNRYGDIMKTINKKDFPMLSKRIDEVDELDDMFPSLYHATTISSAKSILKEGILMEKCGKIHGEMQIRPLEKTIYLSRSEYSGNLNTNLFEKNEKVVVIEIDSKDLDQNKIYPDDGMYCAFANEDLFYDAEELGEFFKIPKDEAEDLFNMMENSADMELVELTKPLWKLYLIKEGEISVAHDIKPSSIKNIRDFETQEIITIEENLKKEKKRKMGMKSN